MKVWKKPAFVSKCGVVLIQLSLLCAAASLLFAQDNLRSGDGYVRREGNDWVIGTSSVERRIRFDNDHLYLVSLRNKLTGREYQDVDNSPRRNQVPGERRRCEFCRLALEASW